jgi:23S rRNA (cytidine2498-2'-O)-methyltransferase
VIRSAYLAAEGFEPELEEELARSGRAVSAWHGRLALSPDPPAPTVWALDIWTAPVEAAAPSVRAAADTLRVVQRNWSCYGPSAGGRAGLIAARLPPVRARPLVFPEPAPASHLGAWTLLAPDRLLFSPTKSSPFVNGEVVFEEDHIGPPSRAYLKLWEALTRMGEHPGPGDTCIDLGASPGGWTWVLATLGADVLAVDRAPLDPRVAAMPGVRSRAADAFAVRPEAADWLVCDVIAYPARLLELAQAWIAAGTVRRIVCTIKLQGATDHASIEAFAALPGATVAHLLHNRHEATMMWRSSR